MSWTVNTQSASGGCLYSARNGQWCPLVSDSIASVSLGVHSLILHLSARTLLAHSSYILYRDLAKNVGKIF